MARKATADTKIDLPWHWALEQAIQKGCLSNFIYIPAWARWYSHENADYNAEGQVLATYPWMKSIEWDEIRTYLRHHWEVLDIPLNYCEKSVKEIQVVLQAELARDPKDLHLTDYAFMNGMWITAEQRFEPFLPGIDSVMMATWGFPFDFDPDKATPQWDKWIGNNPNTWRPYFDMWQAILNRDFKAQLNFWLLGPSGSGKSTVTFSILKWLDPVVEIVDMNEMTGFGSAGLSHTLIVYEDDMEPGTMSKMLTKMLKTNANVNHTKRKRQIYQAAAKTNDEYFHVIATNQMPRMEQAEEVRFPIYRRAWISQFDCQYTWDADIYDQLCEESKTLLCQLISEPYHPGQILDGKELKSHGLAMQRIWEQSAMPAYWWALNHIEYKQNSTLNADAILEDLDRFYQALNSSPPPEDKLLYDLGRAMRTIGGRKRKHMAEGWQIVEYYNVQMKPIDLKEVADLYGQPPDDAQDEEGYPALEQAILEQIQSGQGDLSGRGLMIRFRAYDPLGTGDGVLNVLDQMERACKIAYVPKLERYLIVPEADRP